MPDHDTLSLNKRLKRSYICVFVFFQRRIEVYCHNLLKCFVLVEKTAVKLQHLFMPFSFCLSSRWHFALFWSCNFTVWYAEYINVCQGCFCPCLVFIWHPVIVYFVFTCWNGIDMMLYITYIQYHTCTITENGHTLDFCSLIDILYILREAKLH